MRIGEEEMVRGIVCSELDAHSDLT